MLKWIYYTDKLFKININIYFIFSNTNKKKIPIFNVLGGAIYLLPLSILYCIEKQCTVKMSHAPGEAANS